MLEFSVIERGGYIPAVEKNKAFLRADGWNDYSFVTMFYLTVFDAVSYTHLTLPTNREV